MTSNNHEYPPKRSGKKLESILIHSNQDPNENRNRSDEIVNNGKDQNAFGGSDDDEEEDEEEDYDDDDAENDGLVEGGEEEDLHAEQLEFDAYKDFNNTGVKYVELLNQSNDPGMQDGGEVINHPSGSVGSLNEGTTLGSSRSYGPLKTNTGSNTDFQHSPPPYTSATSQTRSKNKVKFAPTQSKESPRAQKWRNWRIGVIFVFMLVTLIGVVIFFVIPRQPFISFEVPVTLTGDNGSANFSSTNPTQFLFDSKLSFSFDGRASYIPVSLRSLKATIIDLGSAQDNVIVGKGNYGKNLNVKSSGLTPVEIDVLFKYDASSQTDSVYQSWLKSCQNIEKSKVNGTITRPGLQLLVSLNFKVLGIIGDRGDSIHLNSVSCPVELPA